MTAIHLDDERLQRLLHGELDTAAAAAARDHLAGCAACAARLDEAERDEQAVFGRGFDNGLVVIMRRLMALGLLPVDDPGTEAV